MKIKIDLADEWFSKYIRLRDGECKRCHSPVKFNSIGDPISHQASHFQTRHKENTRFDSENCDTLCTGCHMHFHQNPSEELSWKVAQIGQKAVDDLILRSNLYCKKDRKLQEIIWKQEYMKLKT